MNIYNNMNIGDLILHKNATIISNSPLTISSKSNLPSSGFYYRFKTSKKKRYQIDIDITLLNGDKGFVYSENNIIPRKYIFRKGRSEFKIEFNGIDDHTVCGLLFWNANLNYLLRVDKFSINVCEVMDSTIYNKKIEVKIHKQIKNIIPNSLQKIIIVIYTYNQYYKLMNLLYTLDNNDITNIDIRVLVYDNGSDEKYELYGYNRISVKYNRFNTHYDNNNIYKVYDYMYKDLKNYSFDFIYFLNDNCQIDCNFIIETLYTYSKIYDDKRVIMMMDSNFKNKKVLSSACKAALEVDKADMVFLGDDRILRIMKYSVPNIKSGISEHLTKIIREHNCKIYMSRQEFIKY